MTEREALQSTAQYADQCRVLLAAEIAALQSQADALAAFPGQVAYRSELGQLERVIDGLKRARLQQSILFDAVFAKLDPFGDQYIIQPSAPVVLTPNGLIPASSGYINYQDGATVQAIAPNIATMLKMNPTSINSVQKPADVATFLANSYVIGNLGDALEMRLQLTVKPTDAVNTATVVELSFNIDGVLSHKIFPATRALAGYNVPWAISYNTSAYVGAVWAARGAAIVIQADGPVEVTSRSILVTRLHKART